MLIRGINLTTTLHFANAHCFCQYHAKWRLKDDDDWNRKLWRKLQTLDISLLEQHGPFQLDRWTHHCVQRGLFLLRWVYDACRSARANDEEREKLRHDLRYDLLRIRSFGRYYLKKEIFGDKGLGSVRNHQSKEMICIYANRSHSIGLQCSLTYSRISGSHSTTIRNSTIPTTNNGPRT